MVLVGAFVALAVLQLLSSTSAVEATQTSASGEERLTEERLEAYEQVESLLASAKEPNDGNNDNGDNKQLRDKVKRTTNIVIDYLEYLVKSIEPEAGESSRGAEARGITLELLGKLLQLEQNVCQDKRIVEDVQALDEYLNVNREFREDLEEIKRKTNVQTPNLESLLDSFALMVQRQTSDRSSTSGAQSEQNKGSDGGIAAWFGELVDRIFN